MSVYEKILHLLSLHSSRRNNGCCSHVALVRPSADRRETVRSEENTFYFKLRNLMFSER